MRILTVIFLFVLIYCLRINYPPYPYFDEVYFVPAGRAISQLSGYPEVTHPPLGKLFIALSIRIFGDSPIAWRLPSLIFGAAATALAGYLGFILTGRILMFWLVSLLLACDGLWITQARIALVNAPMMFFILASLVLWWHGHVNASKRKLWWALSGVCAGLAMACKWQGGLVILIPFIFYWCLPENRTLGLKYYLYGLGAAIAAYFSTFMIIPFIHGWSWIGIWNLQKIIPEYHLHIQQWSHRDVSAWYTWPFLIRPIWFGFLYHDPQMPLQYQIVDGILCLGNPFIFLLIIPALVWLAVNFWRNRSALSVIALSGVLVFWLPSAMINRYTLFHHFYPAMPFVVISIAALLDRMWRSSNSNIQMVVACLLVLIIGGAAFFYPLWTGLPMSYSFFKYHIWSPTWM